MSKLSVFLASCCLASAVLAQDAADSSATPSAWDLAVAKAKKIDARLQKNVPANLLYAGKGRYVQIKDFDEVKISEDGKKVESPNLSERQASAKSIWQVLKISQKDLITCPGGVQEYTFGILSFSPTSHPHPEDAFKSCLGPEYLGVIKTVYLTNRNSSLPLTAQKFNQLDPQNYYLALSRIDNGEEKYNLTLGFCKGTLPGVETNKLHVIVGSLVEVNDLTNTIDHLWAEYRVDDKAYTFRASTQTPGMNYLINQLYKDPSFVSTLKDEWVPEFAAKLREIEKQQEEKVKELNQGSTVPVVTAEDAEKQRIYAILGISGYWVQHDTYSSYEYPELTEEQNDFAKNILKNRQAIQDEAQFWDAAMAAVKVDRNIFIGNSDYVQQIEELNDTARSKLMSAVSSKANGMVDYLIHDYENKANSAATRIEFVSNK